MQRTAAASIILAALCAACSENSPSLLHPDALQAPSVLPSRPGGLPGSHGIRLVAVVGDGQGVVNITPTASHEGFSVESQVTVWQTRPDTTFDVKRAVDVNAGGICTSTNFVQLPLPNAGPLVKLTTSPGGAGTVHGKFVLRQLAEGTTLAVRFEVSSEDSSIVLRTECFTVPVK